MTTLPEAKLYHTRRDEAVVRLPASARRPVDAGAADQAEAGGTGAMRIEVERRSGRAKAVRSQFGASAQTLNDGHTDDGFGNLSLFSDADKPTGKPTDPARNAGEAADAGCEGAQQAPKFDLAAAVEAVKAEMIPVRKLRVAGRIAALHQIEAATPEEAVARLREQGVDPFRREALRRAVADEGARAGARPGRNLPSLVAEGQNLPAPRPEPGLPARRGKMPLPSDPGMLSEERRAEEIFRIQRDIARRRRVRLTMLLLRLSAFVFIPSIVAGWYYFQQATPLYATISQFQIQHANSGAAAAGGVGAMMGASAIASIPEAVAVQSYLTSRDAMLRLDQDMGFKRAFQDPSIDALTRLSPDATNEAAFSTYKSSVKIGYDPTEGVINMEVVAPDAQLSRAFSLALIQYAEDQVDQMSARLRSDQMDEAKAVYEAARADVLEAQGQVQKLQEEKGILDPLAEGGAVMARIGAMEGELMQKNLELGTLESNPRPNAGRVDALKGEIARLEGMIAQTRLQLTESTDARNSLAAIGGELRMAEADLATRQQLLASAVGQLEVARIEANKQMRYLSLSVSPVAPDESTYPRAAQNTFVAFLIFSGIYLMFSLTASILREQVSS